MAEQSVMSYRRAAHRRGSYTTSEVIVPEASDVLTLPEAAAYLRCHPKTLRLMAIRGSVPGRRVGWLWRFSQQRLEGWMREAAWDSPLTTEAADVFGRFFSFWPTRIDF
jgi:excisionase family DNA binding protein